jgi:hypothetical protein
MNQKLLEQKRHMAAKSRELSELRRRHEGEMESG